MSSKGIGKPTPHFLCLNMQIKQKHASFQAKYEQIQNINNSDIKGSLFSNHSFETNKSWNGILIDNIVTNQNSNKILWILWNVCYGQIVGQILTHHVICYLFDKL